MNSSPDIGGDRGKIRAHPSDRAGRATPQASLYGESRPYGDHPLRAALRDYRGLIGFLILFALVILA